MAGALILIIWVSSMGLVAPMTDFLELNKLVRGMMRPPRLPPPDSVPPPQDKWFLQTLDHFTDDPPTIWLQRYHMVSDYYTEGGPVFLVIGGEGAMGRHSPLDSSVAVYAKQYNALVFEVEHRYYGYSHPTSDMSVENLRYLSSEQALADLANFITHMNHQYRLPEGTKWIAFGGSYAGNLAAWLRSKYPHLVHGAVASSAPVLAKLDFPEYNEVVEGVIASYSYGCVEAVKNANKEINRLLQYQGGTELISNVFRYSWAVNPSPNCFDYKYKSMIESWRNESWEWDPKELEIGARQWYYQKCTEFGYFQTLENIDVFGEYIPLEFETQICTDIFGTEFNVERVERGIQITNQNYGGFDIDATRVVYVHGSLDPWHALGITETRIPESPAIFIIGTSHCADFSLPSDQDPPTLIAAREEISRLIGSFLN